MTQKKAKEARKAIVDFTIQHKDEFPWKDTESSWKKPLTYYYEDGKWLVDDHIQAWNQMKKINVIVFWIKDSEMWVREVGKLYKDRPICGLLHRINHYDYVKLPQDMDFIQKQLALSWKHLI